MSDQHLSPSIGPRGTLRARPSPLRTASPSPSRQRHPSDELLSHLTPATAAEALQSPTGALKTCLARASISEQAFALKTAIASKTIHDWLEELSNWPWPSTRTSAGFETPPAKRRKPLEPEASGDIPETALGSDVTFFGSLPADDVISYENRIETIKQDMEGLDLEDIKNQVLHNHILPLSRPGTPFSDAGHSVASAFSFSKMEDLTAVVTAITVQTLPVLSKLSRLLRTWSVRLIVLRKVPTLLMMISDAEVALLSGWSAIESLSRSSSTSAKRSIKTRSPATHLSEKDFDVMKTVLQQKVAKPGRDLDFMLDTLEGMMDTLPEEWLDRMESIERDYAEWVIAAERKQTAYQRLVDTTTQAEGSKPGRMKKSARMVNRKPSNRKPPAPAPGKPRTIAPKASPNPTYDGSEDMEGVSSKPDSDSVLSEMNRNIMRQSAHQSSQHEVLLKSPIEEDFEPSILESVNEEEEEPELPPTYFQARKGSEFSLASTALHGSSNYSPEYFDQDAFREASMEPDLPHLPDPDEPFSSDVISPPSSPPLRYKSRSTSVTFKDIPEIAALPEVDSSPPRTPLEPPVVFDPDVSFEWETRLGSPCHMDRTGTISDDDHLQKQLRQLLETIPAKIELKRRGINLNPPDFQLPSRPKPRYSDASRRPASALSSRTDSRNVTPSYSRSGTPSFMLAPVRDTRPRSTSSQGIRLYHLSRSGETPIKLFIRCVGEQNERVMVRVGGGWADLGEYLRDYAVHHGSRSKGEGKVEVTDAVPVVSRRPGSSPGSRPGSAHESPMTPLTVRKTRKFPAEEVPPKLPKTPLSKTSALPDNADTPASEASVRSRVSSHVDWDEEDSSLGLAGPKAAKRRDISDESRAWIESVKQKVRMASGERITTSASSEQLRLSLFSQPQGQPKKVPEEKFGTMGKVGSTKRLFRKN
ncbi:hypothetical protein F5Y14DRAFT_445034 [Nemania sp. NC0429]|nr:hypothetical protein F5Y14DRAFT_445034 [Nemania sp. NC0429]